MSNADFPSRTAGDLELPNGDTVWICTLNSLLRDEAGRKASRYAQKETRGLLKGGADYPDVLAEVKSKTPEEQAKYIVQQDYPAILKETNDRYPLPEEPERADKTPEEYAKACLAWEEDCKKATEKRKKVEESRYAAEVKKNLALTPAVRIDRCCVAAFAEEWGKAFTPRWVAEVIFRATRHADNHTQRYFASAEAYEDADDGVQASLMEFYFKTLDIVKSEEVPTSPAAS